MNESRTDLVHRIFEEFIRDGTAELLLEHLAADAVYRTTAPAGTALDGRFIGPEGVREYFRRAGELLRVEEVHATDFLINGDRVVVLGSERLTLLSGTEDASTHDWATVISFRGPTIVDVCVIEDLSLLQRAC